MPDAPARECYHVKAGGQETSSEVEVTCKVVVLQTYKGNTQRGIILIAPARVVELNAVGVAT